MRATAAASSAEDNVKQDKRNIPTSLYKKKNPIQVWQLHDSSRNERDDPAVTNQLQGSQESWGKKVG